MKTCFLFGHQDAPDGLRPRIEAAVEYHFTELGVRQFIAGGYGNYDRMAAGAVKAVKQRHSDICLTLLLPYHPAERPIETLPASMAPFILREWNQFPESMPLSGRISI